jgi:putative aldouronate transport system substrate-binding protein
MKRIIQIVLVILLVLPAAACGKGKPGATAAAPKSYAEKDRLDVSIALWDMQPAETGSAAAALSAVIGETYGINLQPVAVSQQDYKDKLTQALAAKALPDVFTFEAFADKAFFKQLLDQKALHDLPASATKGLTAVDALASRYRDGESVDGKLYFLPRPDCLGNYRSGAASVLYYRADWGRVSGKAKVGSAPDWQTFNELMAYIKHDDPDQNKLDDTFALSTAGTTGLATVYLNTFGVRPFVLEGGQWVPGVVSQRAKQALQWANEACRSGLIDPESLTQDETAMIDKFCQGKIGMIVMDGTPAGAAKLSAAWSGQADIPLTKAVAVLPQPIGPYGVSFNDDTSYHSATAFSAAVDSKKLPRILRLIDWTLTPDGVTALTYGKLNTDYTLNNGVPQTKLKDTNGQAISYRQKLSGWGALANLGTMAQDWMPGAAEDSFEQLSLHTTTSFWWVNNWRKPLFTTRVLDGALAAFDDSAAREELVTLMMRSSNVEADWTAFAAKYTAAFAQATQQANDLAKQKKITTEE